MVTDPPDNIADMALLIDLIEQIEATHAKRRPINLPDRPAPHAPDLPARRLPLDVQRGIKRRHSNLMNSGLLNRIDEKQRACALYLVVLGEDAL